MEGFIRIVANFIDGSRLKKYYGTHLYMNVRYFNIVMTIMCVATTFACGFVLVISSNLFITLLLLAISLVFFIMCLLGNLTKRYNLFIILITYVFNIIFLPCIYFVGGTLSNGVWLYFIGGLLLSVLFVHGPAFLITIIVQPLYYLGIFYISYVHQDDLAIADVTIKYDSFFLSPYFFLTINFIIITVSVGMLIKSLFVSYMDKRDDSIKMAKELENLSIKDPLTGTYNRRYLFSYIEDIITSTEKDNLSLCIVMYDIDKFKSLNDNYGHVVGDEVLCAVSKLLMDSCREYDIVSRYGGEEFILVFPGIKESDAFLRADQIRSQIENTVFSKQITVPVTISGGIAKYESGMTASRLINISDNNLYQAKETGRNKIVWKGGAPSPIRKKQLEDFTATKEKYGRRFTDIPVKNKCAEKNNVGG
ncbi:MAG: GGDEF domain-containing protein [Oscillospiraceae bacterium]